VAVLIEDGVRDLIPATHRAAILLTTCSEQESVRVAPLAVQIAESVPEDLVKAALADACRSTGSVLKRSTAAKRVALWRIRGGSRVVSRP